MRSKKAGINVITNIVTYAIGVIPSFFVRKVFLDSLGNSLLGLSSLYNNIIGILAIVELGIGSAIIFSLYKPFAENDLIKVKGYLNYYSRFYNIVGIAILAIGTAMLPFLKLFINDGVNMKEAQIYFVLFLINTLIGYLFSYKLCILNVAQEGYKISLSTTLSKLVMAGLQVLFLKYYPNFYFFIIIQIAVNLIYYLCINLYIDKRYKWIKSVKGTISKEEKKSLSINVKALFMHRIGGVVISSTDSIVISSFINLNTVGRYNSYYMIIFSVQSLILNASSGISASVGNLLTENNKENSYKVHKRLFFLYFWIISTVTIVLFNTIKQFIIIWLGPGQILDGFTVGILLINFYFILMREPVEKFKETGGLFYQDRYAPICEAAINLVSSIILVKLIGLPGVFLGTLASNLSVVFWIKPKLTYKYIFERKVREYFQTYFKYIFISFIPFGITYLLTYKIRGITTLWALGINCLLNILVITGTYLIIFWRNEEFNYFKSLALNQLTRVNLFIRKGGTHAES